MQDLTPGFWTPGFCDPRLPIAHLRLALIAMDLSWLAVASAPNDRQ